MVPGEQLFVVRGGEPVATESVERGGVVFLDPVQFGKFKRKLARVATVMILVQVVFLVIGIALLFWSGGELVFVFIIAAAIVGVFSSFLQRSMWSGTHHGTGIYQRGVEVFVPLGWRVRRIFIPREEIGRVDRKGPLLRIHARHSKRRWGINADELGEEGYGALRAWVTSPPGTTEGPPKLVLYEA